MFPYRWNWHPLEEPPNWTMGLFPVMEPLDSRKLAEELREAMDSGKDPDYSAADLEETEGL